MKRLQQLKAERNEIISMMSRNSYAKERKFDYLLNP